jgi:hypothetical protein
MYQAIMRTKNEVLISTTQTLGVFVLDQLPVPTKLKHMSAVELKFPDFTLKQLMVAAFICKLTSGSAFNEVVRTIYK